MILIQFIEAQVKLVLCILQEYRITEGIAAVLNCGQGISRLFVVELHLDLFAIGGYNFCNLLTESAICSSISL